MAVLIESSAWRQGKGEDPSRIVLRNVGGYQPFATHIEVRRPSGETFTVVGHYFVGIMDATMDFQQRVAHEIDKPVVASNDWPNEWHEMLDDSEMPLSEHPIVGLVEFADGTHYDSRLPGMVPRGWEPGRDV